MDLDNTLWDWLTIWHEPFSAMLRELERLSGIPASILKSDIKKVHEKYGTSEYSFVIGEIQALRDKHGHDVNLREIYDDAVHAFSRERRRVLRLYPSVVETLAYLSNQGVKLAGYTESFAYYSQFRLRNTGLDRFLDCLFSPPDHELPPGTESAQSLRLYEKSRYALNKTQHLTLPADERKPNPRVLLDIVRTLDVPKENVIYIGDDKWKDISMAREAGVIDCWAKYGVAHERPEYALLKEVTHWTPSAVKTQTEVKVEATFVLEEFADILTYFRFEGGALEPVSKKQESSQGS
jgi:FMN phosphatase YigB (HAD superfamily)